MKFPCRDPQSLKGEKLVKFFKAQSRAKLSPCNQLKQLQFIPVLQFIRACHPGAIDGSKGNFLGRNFGSCNDLCHRCSLGKLQCLLRDIVVVLFQAAVEDELDAHGPVLSVKNFVSLTVRVQGSRFRVPRSGFWVPGSGFPVPGSGFQVFSREL